MGISAIFYLQGFCSHLAILPKIIFPPAILNCVKCKNAFISEIVPDRAIWAEIFCLQGICSHLMTFPQIYFPASFGGHLEFLHKRQKHSYLGNGARYSDFCKLFNPLGVCRVMWRLFPKIIFMPVLANILNFCVRCKNAFIVETVQASEIG